MYTAYDEKYKKYRVKIEFFKKISLRKKKKIQMYTAYDEKI